MVHTYGDSWGKGTRKGMPWFRVHMRLDDVVGTRLIASEGAIHCAKCVLTPLIDEVDKDFMR